MPGLRNQHFFSLLTQEARLQPYERARAGSPILQQSRLPASRTVERSGRHWVGKLGAAPRRHDHRPRDLSWPVPLRSVRSNVAGGDRLQPCLGRLKVAAVLAVDAIERMPELD